MKSAVDTHCPTQIRTVPPEATHQGAVRLYLQRTTDNGPPANPSVWVCGGFISLYIFKRIRRLLKYVPRYATLGGIFSRDRKKAL